MNRLFLLTILCIGLYPCLGQNINKKYSNSSNDNKINWQFFTLVDTLEGQVIYHKIAPIPEGHIIGASVTIVKTLTNDTIRILELNNDMKDFKIMSTVIIYPMGQPTTKVLFPMENDTTCQTIKKTCYGLLIAKQ